MAKTLSGHIKSSEPIYVDLSKDIVEPNTTLQFDELPKGKTGLTVFAYNNKDSNTKKYESNLYGLDTLKIMGPGKHTDTCGLHIHSASFTNYEKLNISEFGTGIKFGDHTWSTSFRDTNVYRCGVALKMKNVEEAGECMSFDSCKLFNSYALVESTGKNVTLNFYGCSFDYPSGAFFLLNGARANLYGCHLEGDVTFMNAFPNDIKNDAIFSMFGGQIDLKNSNPYRTIEAFFRSDGGRIYIEKARLSKIPGKHLICGTGDFSVDKVIKIDAPKYVTTGSWKRI